LIGKRQGKVLQTLEGHTIDTLQVLAALVKKSGFSAFCRKWSLDERKALLSMVLSVLLHDSGKAARAFQEAIAKGAHRPDLPHSLFSLAVAHEVWSKAGYPSFYPIGNIPVLELLSIVAHHSLLYSDLYKLSIRRDEKVHIEPEVNSFLQKAFQTARRIFGLSELGNFPQVDIDQLSKSSLGFYVDNGLDWLKKKTEIFPNRAQLKALYTWLLSFVKTSDIVASRVFSERAKEVPEGILESILEAPPKLWEVQYNVEEQILSGRVPYPFQTELADLEDPFVVLRAPCGRGKTEGALLWFLRMKEIYGIDRLVLAMPTQVTSNAMRERLARVFGQENVGLYHGKSFLEHKEVCRLEGRKEEEGDELNPQEELELVREKNFLGEVMVKPVTVTTVDHILYSCVHGFRQADLALGCLQTAALVFDEVHYYDRKMLAELKELFKLLRNMHIPHLLMSGTLPQFLLREGELGKYRFVEDKQGMTFKPFVVEKRLKPLIVDKTWEIEEDFLEEICEGHRRGLVQFIILNTVRKAQEVYKAFQDIPQDEKELLHSRFCYKHRREKEKRVFEEVNVRRKLGKPFLLVSTQVIEVSLDISSHRMFTELAPMDALGQRAGRLNRGNESSNGHQLVIFRPETPEGELYHLPYRDQKLMERTWEVLREKAVSYGDIKLWCDRVYHDQKLGQAQLPEFFEACTLFGHNYDEIRFSEEEARAFRPRDLIFVTVDVIPESELRKHPDLSPSEASLYLAPVPMWWVAKHNEEDLGIFYRKMIGRRSFWVCKVPYCKDFGFEEEKLGEPSSEVMIL